MADTREWYADLPSTQDRAIALARVGAEEGTRVVAGRQTHGRGRLDHAWESPTGGLYLSIVLACPDEHATLLPLALGARLADALGRRYDLPLRVKWPNDVLLVGRSSPSRKLAGILVDRVPSPRFGAAAVAGIGVNVAPDLSAFPEELRTRTAVLAPHGTPTPTLAEVEFVVTDTALATAAAIRDPTGVARLRELCRRLLWGVGRKATLDGQPVGTIVSIGDEGELLVERTGRRMALRAGDLRVEEAP